MAHEHNHGHNHGHEHGYDHGHEHGHEHEEENRKPEIIKLIISGVLFITALLCEHVFKVHFLIYLFIYIAAYAVVGYTVVIEAVKGIIHKEPFDECLLMTVASVGAFIIGSYGEAAAVMILYSLGEFLQDLAVDKSRDSITELIDIVPKQADVLRGGQIVSIPAKDVAVGDTVIVKPGINVPVDGEIISGSASFDTSALTGESYPRDLGKGDTVLSGYLNINGEIQIKATAEYDNSAAARIKELIEGAEAKKAKTENFITKFSKVYTPAVVILALIIAVIPPLFNGEWVSWIHRALTFLVVSCPCALVISVPLSFCGGIGAASRTGILIKGSIYLESLSKASCVVMDKTGTLTEGVFTVTQTHGETLPDAELLRLAAGAERFSSHPIAAAIRGACSDPPEDALITDVRDVAGKGIHAAVCGRSVLVGNRALLEQYGADCPACDAHGTIVYAAVDGRYAGYLVVS
ncbi:MAG: HAD-IC family P-type ATPase, partial [Clostridia bacterium]|nr:HAD-IC family P-type ATPase [Clostridia bacterium]